jgi:hypothetical protein
MRTVIAGGVVLAAFAFFPGCKSSVDDGTGGAPTVDRDGKTEPASPTGGNNPPSGGPTGPSGKAAATAVPVEECQPACGSQQTCVHAHCQDLPPTCPCPVDSYCDLLTNSCKAGCTASDSECSAGRYCDAATRACKIGCRGDAECTTPGQICEDHACVVGCRGDAGCTGSGQICANQRCVTGCRTTTDCPITDVCENAQCVNKCPNCDDGNPCTTDSCERGSCRHVAGNDGAACPTGPCQATASCAGGVCVAIPKPDGTGCGSEYEMCLQGACKNAVVYCTNDSGGGFTYADSTGRQDGFNVDGSCSCASSSQIATTDDRSHACSLCATSALHPNERICWE